MRMRLNADVLQQSFNEAAEMVEDSRKQRPPQNVGAAAVLSYSNYTQIYYNNTTQITNNTYYNSTTQIYYNNTTTQNYYNNTTQIYYNNTTTIGTDTDSVIMGVGGNPIGHTG